MKVSLYTALINEISKNQLFFALKNRNKNEKHIVICPDRCTLNIEKELFEVLDEKCFFDLSVITLSRLAKKASKLSPNEKVLTKNSAVALIKKLLLDNKNNLTSFKNAISLSGFAGELYNTICLFKSCHITPIDIDIAISNKTLKSKLSDIKLIYEKYEEFLQNNFTDSFNRLDLFARNINKGYGDTNFYFVMFEDFTVQQYNIIGKLIKHAKSVSFATTYSKSQPTNNELLHLNSVYFNVLDLCRQLGVAVNTKKCISNLKAEENLLLENLFSTNCEQSDLTSDNIKLLSFKSLKDEVKHTLLDIKQNIILNKTKFNDFTIIVPSLLTYASEIKKQCEKMDVSYYLDESTPLKSHVFCRFIINALKIVCGEVNKYNVLDILKSPFANVDQRLVERFEHYLTKYGLVGKSLINIKNEEFAIINSYFENYNNAITDFKNANAFGEKMEYFTKFLFDVTHESEEIHREKLLGGNNIIDYRTHEQVISKLNKAFDELQLVLDSHDCTAKEFSEICLAVINDITLTLPPIAMDAVFIGEINISYFRKNKNVYILGANEGSMPSYQLDTSIITDKDISELKNKNKLNPTVAVINKRKRFKVYESIFVYEKSLVISYIRQKENGDLAFPTIWYDDMKNLLNIKEYDASADFDMIFNAHPNIVQENIIFNNINLENAKENYTHLLKQWNVFNGNKNYVNLLHSLQHSLQLTDANFTNKIMKNINYKSNIPNIKKANELFFKNNYTSISELENYFECPYKFFISYGLKLRKQEDEANIDNGIILHEFLKIIVPLICENIDSDDWLASAKTTARDIMHSVLHKPKYDYITTNEYNNFYCHAFLNEAERITDALIYQQQHSKFVPTKKSTEQFFKSDTLSINVGNRKIYLKGVIDRVDACGDSFRVIDYKTGSYSSKFNDLSDIYNGKKIQLIVYTKIYENASGLKPAGAFYLPILNVFDKEDAKCLYKLQGIIVKNLENILNFDDNLANADYVSKIVNLSTDKYGAIKDTKLCITESELDKLCNYVFDLMKKGAEKILVGELQPNPMKASSEIACEFCDYKAICNFNENYGDETREKEKVKNFEEFKALTEEEVQS